jgi:hypothetical protein
MVLHEFTPQSLFHLMNIYGRYIQWEDMKSSYTVYISIETDT